LDFGNIFLVIGPFSLKLIKGFVVCVVMTTAAVRFKIMPESPETDLESIKSSIKEKVESFDSGVFSDAVEEPIAFGLKALIVTLAIAESEEVDHVETALKEIDGVSSIEMIDYRRAVG
jgi:elongation factor 1-beta